MGIEMVGEDLEGVGGGSGGGERAVERSGERKKRYHRACFIKLQCNVKINTENTVGKIRVSNINTWRKTESKTERRMRRRKRRGWWWCWW